MAAADQGNILASRLIHRAHAEAGWYLYAPSYALVEADRGRPGTAEHLAALPGITVWTWMCPLRCTWPSGRPGRLRIASTRRSPRPSVPTVRSWLPPRRSDGTVNGSASWTSIPKRILRREPRLTWRGLSRVP